MAYSFGGITTPGSCVVGVPVTAMPALLAGAVHELPGFSLLSADDKGAFVVRRTALVFRAWTISLTFSSINPASTRVEATYRPLGAGLESGPDLLGRLFSELESGVER